MNIPQIMRGANEVCIPHSLERHFFVHFAAATVRSTVCIIARRRRSRLDPFRSGWAGGDAVAVALFRARRLVPQTPGTMGHDAVVDKTHASSAVGSSNLN